jgi:hypothetical protein
LVVKISQLGRKLQSPRIKFVLAVGLAGVPDTAGDPREQRSVPEVLVAQGVASLKIGISPVEVEPFATEFRVSSGVPALVDDVVGHFLTSLFVAGCGARRLQTDLYHFRGKLLAVIAPGRPIAVSILPDVNHLVNQGR